MNTQTIAPAKRSGAKKKPATRKKSGSERATETARRGEPLSVASPRERSPKQENL